MFQILTILLCFQLHLTFSDDLYAKFQQNDYEIQATRLDNSYYNKDFYKKFEIVTFKYNRSLPVANLTFQQKVYINAAKINVVIQGYKFLSNEYRIFPIHFQLNLCRLIEQNIGGTFDVLRRCGNLKRCHAEKNVVYNICNMYPDPSRLPPFIPSGEYKLELKWVYQNKTLSVINVYAKVFRPIKIY